MGTPGSLPHGGRHRVIIKLIHQVLGVLLFLIIELLGKLGGGLVHSNRHLELAAQSVKPRLNHVTQISLGMC